MFTGTHATSCNIPKTAFKILKEVAPDAIEKFIATCNALYPRGPPNPDGKQWHFQKDKCTVYSEKPATDQPIPTQYENDCKLLAASQEGPDSSSNKYSSNTTYGNGEETDEEDGQKIKALMRLINMS